MRLLERIRAAKISDTEDGGALYVFAHDPGVWPEAVSLAEGSDSGRGLQSGVSRGVLKLILAGYLGCVPREVRFDYGAEGKPEISGASLFFNLSHSGAYSLVGVSRRGAVGVDLEQVRPLSDQLAIARRFFTAQETAELQALPDAEAELGFFRIWTRKEAIAKTEGGSIFQWVSRVRVSASEANLGIELDGSLSDRWRLRNVAVPDGYVAAYALAAPQVSRH